MSIKYLDSTGISKMFNLIKTALAGKQDALTFDASPTSGSNNPVKSGGVYTALGNKQDSLTFDDSPTSGSSNPVKSKGIYTALQGKQDSLTFDDTPTDSSTNPVKSGGVYTALSGKQDTLDYDSSPTLNSTKMVKSGGIYTGILKNKPLYTAVCETAAGTTPKVLMIRNAPIDLGIAGARDSIFAVMFKYGNTVSGQCALQIYGGSTTCPICLDAPMSPSSAVTGYDAKNLWADNEIVFFYYNGYNFVAMKRAASGTVPGVVKISNSTSSTAQDTAASSKAVKTAYDLAASKQSALTFDASPTSGSDNPVKSGGVYTALQGKQDALTFDDAPTSGSSNPVKSKGIYTALQGKQDSLTFDNAPTENSTNMVKSGAIYTALQNAGGNVTVDSALSSTSTNPVQNSKIYNALAGKADNTLSQPLVVSGGDGASAGKISLDQTQSGQITNNSDSTLFGFTSNNTSDLTVGHSNYALKLRGSGTRAKYNGNDVALYSDLPTVPSDPLTLSTKSGYDCNTRYDGKIWLIGSGSNCPSGSQYGALFTLPYRQASGNSKPDFGAQIFLPNGDDATKPNSMFYRTSLANTWNAWKEVAVEGACNADKVDGYHISVVNALPASPDANTIYIVV